MDGSHEFDTLARRIETLLRNDTFSATLGIRLHDVRPGMSVISVPVKGAAMNSDVHCKAILAACGTPPLRLGIRFL